MDKGKLYIVATPIGNLSDITYRAVDVLKNVAFVLAEDTRETYKLFNHYSINTQLVSYRDQNHERMIEKIEEKLNLGLDLALVSDCGTPLISDPGYKLVRDLRIKNYEILSIPGASALTSAVAMSGLPTDIFTFLGFLPKSDKRRNELIVKYLKLDNTLVIYESPNRMVKLLELLKEIDKNLYISAIRDISKKREFTYWGKIETVLNILDSQDFKNNPHGEWVVLISTKI